MNLIQHSALALAVLVAAGSASTQAVAAQREKIANAAGVCQSALPAFEGLIRKRPLGIQNEGSSNAFVTCSLISDSAFGGSAGTEGSEIAITNNASATQFVSCTAIVGPTPEAAPIYYTISGDIPSGATGFFQITVDDNGGVAFDPNATINFSCNLPPQTLMSKTYVWYKVDEPT